LHIKVHNKTILGNKTVPEKMREIGIAHPPGGRLPIALLREIFDLARTKPEEAVLVVEKEKLMMAQLLEKRVLLLENTKKSGDVNVSGAFPKIQRKDVAFVVKSIGEAVRLKKARCLLLHACSVLLKSPVVFEEILQHLENSTTVFAINLGEDDGHLQEEHFKLLYTYIKEDKIGIRRWFVEIDQGDRKALLVSNRLYRNPKVASRTTHPHVFTTKLREDKELWRNATTAQRNNWKRFAWLRATEGAWKSVGAVKTALQKKLFNFKTAKKFKDICDNATHAEEVPEGIDSEKEEEQPQQKPARKRKRK
jgi:hypothetical protein